MKRLTFVLALLIVSLSLAGCQKRNADAQDIKLARDLADAFGRTPANSITEFQGCGMMECRYEVWFTTEDGYDAVNARIAREISSRGLVTGRVFGVSIGPSVVNDLNGSLPQTSHAQDRLIVISGTHTLSENARWELMNQMGQIHARITFYVTKGTGAEFIFGSKPLTGNIIAVEVYVNPRKP